MKFKRKLLSIIMTTAMITTLFAGLTISASAYTATGTMTALKNSGNSSEVITSNEEGTCSLKTTLTSIKPTDSEPGKVRIKVELLSTTDDIYQIFVHINSSLDSSAFRFSSTKTKVGLFASNTWSDQDKLNMLENGLISISEGKFLTLGATNIGFAQDGGLDIGKTGTLFTATLPVNPEYEDDWQNGLENILTVSYDIYSNGAFSGAINSDAFSFPPAGMESPSSSEINYNVKPVIISDKENLEVGDTFQVNAVVTADQAEAPLAAVDAVLDYDKDLVKLVSAEPAGLKSESSTVDLQSGRMILNGDSVTVGEDGVVVATYTFEALKAGDAKFSIAEGAKVGKSGNPTDLDAVSGDPLTVTITESSGTVVLISNADYKGTADGQQMLRYTAKALPKEGNAYFYGESPLQYVGPSEDGQPVFAGFVSSELQSVEASSIEEKAGSYESVVHDGDVNQNQTVNAIDCLIAYDLATGNKIYLEDSSYELLSVLSRLEADVTNNAVVDALDARAIMNKALGKAA